MTTSSSTPAAAGAPTVPSSEAADDTAHDTTSGGHAAAATTSTDETTAAEETADETAAADAPGGEAPTAAAVPQKSFADFGLDPALVKALADQGITAPFPIQATTLPMALNGADIIGQARTGTGKTFGFGLPALHRVDVDRAVTQVLVVTPTRELCLQVTDDLRVGEARGVTIMPIYGGVGYEPQIEALRAGVHVVVGTPGRLLDLHQRRDLDLSNIRTLVLDEADEMLDLGFLPDVERLISACPDDRHTMLFSATMPPVIVSMARKYMDKPTFMRAEMDLPDVAPTVEQFFFVVHQMDKPRVLARILQQPGRGGVYVFCRTKRMCDRLVDELDNLGVKSITVHGDLSQAKREQNLDRFRDGRVDVLVATEVAARGLDVEDVTHVVNYDCPDDEKMYLHRIGRTARAGAKGVAVTFAQHDEITRLSVIRKAVEAEDHEVHEVFSTSPLLAEMFDLPEQTPWGHLARTGGGGSASRSPRGGQRSGRSSGASRPRDGRHNADRSVRSREAAGAGDAGTRDTGSRERSRSRSAERSSPRAARAGGTTTTQDTAPTANEAATTARDTDEAPRPQRQRKGRRGRDDRGTNGRDRDRQASGATRSDTDTDAPDAAAREQRDTTPSGARNTVTTADGVRIRVRDRGSRGTAGADRAASGDDGRATRDRDDAAPREGGNRRRRGARADADDRRDDAADSGDAATTSRRGRGGRDATGRSGGTRNSARSTSRSRDAGRASGRGRDGDGASTGAARSRQRTTRRGDDARGDGTPGFRRSVTIERLP